MAKIPQKQTVSNIALIPSDYQSAVISSLKRSFSRGLVVREFLKKHRREEDWIKKDGSKAKKKHVFYTCAQCKKEFNSSQVQVDHIEPVVPLNIPAKHMSMSDFLMRLYVEEDGLQILCKTDHKEKSKEENLIRQQWVTKKKYIVYQTVNRLNHKSYIGVHACEDYDDGVLGNGLLLKKAIEKYGTNSFYRSILYTYDEAKDAYAKEKELLNADSADKDNNTVIEKKQKRIICHQTGQIFESIKDVAIFLNTSQSSVSKVVNNAKDHINNLHLFTTDSYDPNVSVEFPIDQSLRKVVHLNSKTTFESVEKAAISLNLNYKNLLDALLIKTSDNVYSLDDNYFLFDYEYDSSSNIEITHKKILCVELNKIFDSNLEAAYFLKHKNPNFCAIGIGRAIRTGAKMYKYHWKSIEKKQLL